MQLEGSLTKRGGITIAGVLVTTTLMADRYLPGWGNTVGTTAGVFSAASIMWPQFRKRFWYWGTLTALLAIQIAIVSHFDKVRVFIESLSPFVWFLFIILDFLWVATAVILVASGVHRRES